MSVVIKIVGMFLIFYIITKFRNIAKASRLEEEKEKKAQARKKQKKMEAIENEKKRVEAEANEAARIAAYQKKLGESYFLEQDGGETPYSMEEIKNLMQTGDLKLNSKIKYGYENNDYKPVFSFEELNQDFKDFL
jgi:hypothetical protein